MTWVQNISRHSIEILRSAGIKVSCVLREGDPKKELPKTAEEWGADCNFVGSAEFSNRFERFVLGAFRQPLLRERSARWKWYGRARKQLKKDSIVFWRTET